MSGPFAAASGAMVKVFDGLKAQQIQLTYGAGAGKMLSSDANGVASWSTVSQEVGMMFPVSATSTSPLTLTGAAGEAIYVLTGAVAVVLPEITGADVPGHMYVIVNKHSAATTVTPNAADKIDNATTGTALALPADGKVMIVASDSTTKTWFTI